MTYAPAAETARVDPHLFVLFGATGDLARRSLLPSLFKLLRRRGFQDRMHLVGVARSDMDDAGFRKLAVAALVSAGADAGEAGRWAEATLSYHRVTTDLVTLADLVVQLEREHHLPGNRVFYLAIPPRVFDDTVEHLAKAGLNSGPGWTRVVVEKPFGYDVDSARRLNQLLHRWYDERQIYRIDHYLAKETVQNLMVFRFANPLFELAWNRDRVDSIAITVAETLGVEGRARYLDRAGIVRDIVQNHIMQVLTLVAMEPPVRLEADEIRDEKVKVLRAVYPLTPEAIVRGQYTAGTIDGRPVPGYLEEEGVPADSTTETYAAIRLEIDNWRWRGVPFYLRTGKRLQERVTQIAVRFKAPPVYLFGQDGPCELRANVLYITLQPDEGFDLMFDMKTPGEGMELQTWPLSFRYEQAFGPLVGAYETLLMDVLTGDQTLFVRADEAEEAWRIVGPVLDPGTPPEPYPAGSWGPEAADRLVEQTGDRWLLRLAQRKGHSAEG